jgi:hypothetical protein
MPHTLGAQTKCCILKVGIGFFAYGVPQQACIASRTAPDRRDGLCTHPASVSFKAALVH